MRDRSHSHSNTTTVEIIGMSRNERHTSTIYGIGIDVPGGLGGGRVAKGGNSSSSSVGRSYPLKIVLGVEESVPSSRSSPNTFRDRYPGLRLILDSGSILRIRTGRGGRACKERATRRNDACRAGHVTRYGDDCSCSRELRAAFRENLGRDPKSTNHQNNLMIKQPQHGVLNRHRSAAKLYVK